MKTKVTSFWSDEILESCEREREEHRKRHGRITFDCFGAVARGDRVFCTQGETLHHESKDGSMYLLAVLRGRTSSACKACEHYEEE